MYIVRLTLDASWYPASDSTMFHARVVKFQTDAPLDEQITELHDHRLEVLHGGGDPVALAKGELIRSIVKWGHSIGSFEPF